MSTATDERHGMWRALANPHFRRLTLAFALSRCGDQIFSIALLVYVLDRTGSVTWVAALMVLRLLPMVVVGPVAGVLADRLPRRALMIGTDLVRLGLMLVLMGLVSISAPLWLIVAVTVLTGVVGTPYLPSFTASLPRVVDERHLAGANATVSVVDYVSSILGPAIGALVAAFWGLQLALVVNAVSFAFSAVLLLTIRIGLDRRHQAPAVEGVAAVDNDDDELAAWSGLRSELLDGLRAVVSDRVLRVMVAALVLTTLAFGFELVYLVFVSRDLLGTGASGVGYLSAAVGVGGVAGAFVVGRLANMARPKVTLVWVSLLSMLPMAALAFISTPAIAYGVMFVEGAASVALDVVAVTTMQRNVSDALLARADALIAAVCVAATMLGGILAPPLLSLVGLQAALVLAAAIPSFVAVAFVVRLRERPVLASIEERRQSVLTLLGEIEPLRDLGPTQREQLAVAAESVAYKSGDALVREGEAPDLVVLLATGRAEVVLGEGTATARQLKAISGPDIVGEIGVVEQRPRTATVRATEPCTGYRVSAAVFVDAMSLMDTDMPSLKLAIGSRLTRSLAT